MDTSTSKTHCPLCASPTARVIANRLRRGSGTVFYCEPCDHGFLVPDRKVDAKTYYGESYRNEYSHKATGDATHARELFDTYRKYQAERIKLISPYLSSESSVLEIGASAGQFLANILDRVALVNAIELDKSCCEFMQGELGIQADSEFLRSSKFAAEKYDVVCTFQVMEHVESPVDFLKDLRRSMKENGVAFVEVPNLHDPLLSVWDIQAYQVFFYHAAHLHYFTETSLRRVAADAGFSPEQINVKYTQDYNLLNHLNWITNNAPQATCDVGLSDIDIRGADQEIAGWLTAQIQALNFQYVEKLIEAKRTSNLMMVLTNAP